MFTSVFTPKHKQSKVATFDDMVAPWLLQQERWRQEDEQKASSATSPSDSSRLQRGKKPFCKIGIVAIKRIATRVLRRTQKTDAPTSTMAAASGAAVTTPVPTLVPTLVSSPPVTCISSEDVPTSSTTGPTTLSHPGYMASSPAADNGLIECAQDTSAHECTVVPSPTASSYPSTLEPATPATDTHLCDGSKSAISDFVLESSAVEIELAIHETADGVFDCHNPEDERRPGSPAHEVPDATLKSITTSYSAADDLSSAICPAPTSIAPTPIAPTVAHPASSVTMSAAVEAHPASIANSISAHPSSTTTTDTAVEAHPASIATDGPLVTAESAWGMESELAGSALSDATDGSAAEAPLASSASPVRSSAVSEVHGLSVDGDTSVNATVDAPEISLVAPEVWNWCYMRDEGIASLSDLTGSEDVVPDTRRCWEAEALMGKSDRSSSSYSPSGSFLYIPGLGSSTCDASADDADSPVAAASTDREDQEFGSLRLGDGGSESGAHSSESEDWYGVEAARVAGRRGHIESGYPTAARTGERAQVIPRRPQGLPARHPPAQPNWADVHPMPPYTPPRHPPTPPQPRPGYFNSAAVNPALLHPPLPPHLNQPGFTDRRFNSPIGNRGPLHPHHPPPMYPPQHGLVPGGFNPAAVYHPPVQVASGPWYVPGRGGLPPHQLQAGNSPRAAGGPPPPNSQRPYSRQQKNNGAQPYRQTTYQRQQKQARDIDRPFDFIECVPTI